MAVDEELRERFKELDEGDWVEQAAQELARRVRREERFLDQRYRERALAILEAEDEDEGKRPHIGPTVAP